ncbi:MAG: hypothetical protein IKQ71_11555 [Lachnospiraceae bacterium]|nr:hypothetical protein [Lachnospiraceae bacterium]
MKEVDELVNADEPINMSMDVLDKAADVYRNIGDEEPYKKENAAFFESLIHKFENSSGPERYDLYFDLQHLSYARPDLGQKLSQDEKDYLTEIDQWFEGVVGKINKPASDLMFDCISKEMVETALAYEKEKKWINTLIDAKDPHHNEKVRYLMSSTASNFRFDACLEAKGNFSDWFNSFAATRNITEAKGITLENSMDDFAKACGFKKEEIPGYLANMKAQKDETIASFFTRRIKISKMRDKLEEDNKNKIISDEEYNKAVENPEKYDKKAFDAITVDMENLKGVCFFEFTRQYSSNTINDAIKKHAKENKSTSEKYYEIQDSKVSEVKTKKISEWVKIGSEGRNMLDVLSIARSRGMICDLKKKHEPSKEVSYDQYILRHSGYNETHKDIKMAPDVLAKAISASILKKSGKSFDLKSIRSFAKEVKKMSEFKEIIKDPLSMVSCLADPAAVELTTKRMIERTYGVEPYNIETYINKMSKLYANIKPTGSRSAEYNNFRLAVANIAGLKDKYDLNSPDGMKKASEELIRQNANLLANCEKYMEGKEKVRSSEEGRMRFNNSLDALSILSQYSPRTKEQVMLSVDRINKKRGVKENDPKYVRINDYGERRAERAILEKKNAEMSKGKKQADPVAKM